MKSNKNIAIDGPAGAGKSTIAKELAKRLNLIYVDTGAMYRAMALYFLRNRLDASQEEEIREACGKISISIVYENGKQQVYLNGENVTSHLREEEVGRMASATSVYAPVRTKLVQLQQELAATTNVVMDGRDIGTVVLPDAALKIFLTASVEERARRRYLELQKRGEDCDIVRIREDIEDRDRRDRTRAISPLRQAEDAKCVDCSNLSIEQVVEKILTIYQKVGQE